MSLLSLEPAGAVDTHLHAQNQHNALLEFEQKNKARLVSLEFQVQQAVKRFLDVLLGSLILLVLLPFLSIVALLVLTTSKGPLFYKSKRLGKHQQPFYMYKFRTMVPEADKLREQLRQENQQEGELFKLKEDPRIVPFGAFMRKFSLDEFPQLLNVLKGEMSLVGPRPFSPDNCKLFTWPVTARFNLTPGMTGLWQVSGRSNLSFEQMCELELEYVRRWSLVLDFSILLRTLPAVLLKKGSC